MITHGFDSLSRIGRVKAPILVMHGESDRVVPARFGQALFNAVPEPKEGWFVPAAGHEDFARYGGLDTAVAFIERRHGGWRGGLPPFFLPNIRAAAPGGIGSLPPYSALTVNLAVKPQSLVPDRQHSLGIHGALPSAAGHDAIPDRQRSRNSARWTLSAQRTLRFQ
jgi:hypothetical protein